MGTRHLILVYYKGTYHIAQYGQLDGYPSFQGVKVLSFIADPSRIAKLRASLDNPALLYTPTDKQLQDWEEEADLVEQEYYNRNPKTEAEVDAWKKERPTGSVCPSIHSRSSARILDIVADAAEDPVPIVKAIEFMTDALFCEWVYLVDLDTRTFEVYTSQSGFDPLDADRSRFRDEEKLKDAKYLPPLVGKFSIHELPDETRFLTLLEPKDEEDGE